MDCHWPYFVFFGLLAIGSFDEFWYWIYEHPSKYVSKIEWSEGQNYLLFFAKRVFRGYELSAILPVLALPAMFFIRSMNWKPKLFALLFLIFGALSIFPGMRFYGHYWLHFFPAWCFLTGILGYGIYSWTKNLPYRSWILLLFILGMNAYHVLANQGRYFDPNTDLMLKWVHPDNPYPEHRYLSQHINKILKKEDQIAVMGSEPQIYLYTDRKAPFRHFYHALTSKETPESEAWQREVLQDLKKANPELIVFNIEPYSWMFQPNSKRILFNGAYSYAKNNYNPVMYVEMYRTGQSKLIVGDQVQNFTPRTERYITVYKKK